MRNVTLKNWAAKIQRETGQQRLTIDRMLLLIVVIWVLALLLSEAQLRLPPETQTVLNTLYATVGLALAVTWWMRDNRKQALTPPLYLRDDRGRQQAWPPQKRKVH